MRTETPREIKLADYRPPAFLIDTVDLDFQLEANHTRVKSRLAVRRNGEHAESLVLDQSSTVLDAVWTPHHDGQWYAWDCGTLRVPQER